MKKILRMGFGLILAASLTACSGGTGAGDGAAGSAGNPGQGNETTAAEPKSELVTGMIAYTFGTQSFSDDVLLGLQQAEEQLGIPHHELEIADVTETANGFRTLIQQGCNFVVASTAEYCDGMLEVAAEYPDVYFLYLAEHLADAPDNVISFEYREQEASFLAGALAGLLTQSDKIGAVLAMPEPLQDRYQYGYITGAKAVNPDCDVMITFTNSYADTNIGYEHASAMYAQGCDFVGCYAGACNLGVFKAAEEAGDGKYCFGAANGQFDKGYDKILASVVKPVNEAIVALLKDGQETGSFDTDISSLGLKEHGVVLKYTDNEELLSLLSEREQNILRDLEEQIVSGALVIPGTEADAAEFQFVYE